MHEHSRKWFWLTKCWRINEIRMHWSHRVDVLGDGLVVLVREDGKNGGSEVKHVEEDMTLILLSTSSLFLLLYTTKLISCCTSKFFSALAHVKWQLCTFIQFFFIDTSELFFWILKFWNLKFRIRLILEFKIFSRFKIYFKLGNDTFTINLRVILIIWV